MESKRAVNQVLSPVRPWAETRRKRGRWAGSYSSDRAALGGPGFCFFLNIIFLAVLVLPKSSCSREAGIALVEYAWKLDGGWIGCNISPGGVWGAWCFMGKTRFAYKLSLDIGWHYKMIITSSSSSQVCQYKWWKIGWVGFEGFYLFVLWFNFTLLPS